MIKRTKNTITKHIEDKFNNVFKVENELLLKTGLCFENLYKKIHSKNWFPKNSMKKSNQYLFNNYAKSVNYFNKNEKLDFSKIIANMEKTKNPHLKIIEAVILKEKLLFN